MKFLAIATAFTSAMITSTLAAPNPLPGQIVARDGRSLTADCSIGHHSRIRVGDMTDMINGIDVDSRQLIGSEHLITKSYPGGNPINICIKSGCPKCDYMDFGDEIKKMVEYGFKNCVSSGDNLIKGENGVWFYSFRVEMQYYYVDVSNPGHSPCKSNSKIDGVDVPLNNAVGAGWNGTAGFGGEIDE